MALIDKTSASLDWKSLTTASTFYEPRASRSTGQQLFYCLTNRNAIDNLLCIAFNKQRVLWISAGGLQNNIRIIYGELLCCSFTVFILLFFVLISCLSEMLWWCFPLSRYFTFIRLDKLVNAISDLILNLELQYQKFNQNFFQYQINPTKKLRIFEEKSSLSFKICKER